MSRRILARRTIGAVVLLVLVGAGTYVFALGSRATYHSPNPIAGAGLGFSVAGFSEQVVLGAPHRDKTLNGVQKYNVGEVHVFETPSARHLRTIDNPEPSGEDNFGISVAVLNQWDASPRLVIGAPGDDTGARDAGAVYVYNPATGTRLRTIRNPDPDVADRFGTSVAFVWPSAILVGAPGDSTQGDAAGAAYLFSSSTGALLATFYADDPERGANFGMAVSGNNFAIVGAPGASSGDGAAYILDPADGHVVTRLVDPSPGADLGGTDGFGTSVAALAGNVLIGAPGEDAGEQRDAGTAYVYNTGTGDMRTIDNPDPDPDDSFGKAVLGIRFDRALIGAPLDDTVAVDAGAAYWFNTNTGALLQTFSSPADGGGHCGEGLGFSYGSGPIVGCWRADYDRAGEGGAYLFQEADGPEMSVNGGADSVPIRSGATKASTTDGTSFGTIDANGSVTRTFSIMNIGSRRLDLTGKPRVAITGSGAANFSVSDEPDGSVAAGGLPTTFSIRFSRVALYGAGWCPTVKISSNDASENPYTFKICGTGKW